MIVKENPTLSIIIVSYNTCKMTLACVKSVFDETNTMKFEIIIVDNASSDDSAEEIEKEFVNSTEFNGQIFLNNFNDIGIDNIEFG